jgi:hypothetical protein
MTRTLVIVGCGAAKRDTEAPAKDLYTSTYFAKKRAYAETIGDDWQVLSAEYGLVPHDFVIKPYETHIDDLDDRELDLLAHSVGMDLINLCARKEFDEVRVLAGRSYLDPLREREAFATAPATVRFPLQEADCGGIGEQMQWLDERVAAYGEQQRLMTDGGQCAGGMVHAKGPRVCPIHGERTIPVQAAIVFPLSKITCNVCGRLSQFTDFEVRYSQPDTDRSDGGDE